MKTILAYIVISVAMACCKPLPESPKVQVCDFGIEEKDFNLVKRELPEVEDFAARNITLKQPKKNPRATTTFLLDFNGHTVEGTPWNYIPSIVCAPSGFTVAQQQAILDSVYEKFKEFNVNVTSDEKSREWTRANKRMRVIITETWEWYGKAGGVAFVGSLFWNDNTPCFVFSSLLTYDLKKVQDATSHELGHTVGLYHQARYDTACIKISEYNSGCCGEAPIMGLPYNQPNTKWWIGPTSYGCNDIQDDAQILKTKL